jgi:hypothetical protein
VLRERYVKQGQSLRFEWSGRGSGWVHTVEAGESLLEEGRFSCRPSASPPEPTLRDDAIRRLLEQLQEIVRHPLSIDRIVVSAGEAAHRWSDGDVERSWSDRAARLHLGLVHAGEGWSHLLDAGAGEIEAIDLEPLRRVTAAAALPLRPIGAPLLRLAPAVTARLIPLLLSGASDGTATRRVRFTQRATTPEQRDGRGAEIVEGPVSLLQPPNVWRPSYRFRPIASPLDVRLEAPGNLVSGIPEAVVVIEPLDGRDGTITGRLLVTDGEAAGVVHLQVAVQELLETIVTAAAGEVWFPAGTGCWGVPAMIRVG